MTQLKVVGLKRTREGDLALLGDNEDWGSFEAYLLEFEVSQYQKFMARIGREMFIGKFKAEKPGYDFAPYYLSWCQVHRRYVITYYQGYDRRLDCPECNTEFLFGVNKDMEKSDKKENKEKSLSLVKSDKGLEP